MDRVCNIDAKGRIVRFFTGIFAILTGFVLAILISQGFLSSETYWIVVAGSITVSYTHLTLPTKA